MLWCVSVTTGSSFGDVTPDTNIERAVAIFVMLIGAAFYVKIFDNFVKIINL